MKEITTEIVNTFINGHDPMEKIISIECGYMEDKVSIIFINKNNEKRVKLDDFKPFVWVKHSAAIRLFNGDRTTLRSKLRSYGISIKSLETSNGEEVNERLENGYKYLFYANRKMTYQKFLSFFKEGGVPIHEKAKPNEPNISNKEFMSVTPIEQYMISTGRRLFKGYENYNDLSRFIFDLETQGLNPKIHRIEQIGIHHNKGFDKVICVEGKTKEELDESEINAIELFLYYLAKLKPDTIVGHNSENFDWNFLIVRCEQLGYDFSELSLKYFKHPIYKKKKETVLKLGGEVEYYYPTIIWGHNVLDSLHAARRAQAIDSNMKSSNLKYVTKYLNLKKENRVYVQGDKISTIWNIKEKIFALCEENGDWYKITDENPLKDGCDLVSGRYIVERYLLDDLWETDKIEDRLNESNFLVSKMLPTTFSKACTMGTAGIWKLIMLAWCYENNLAIPSLGTNKKFTGGLSRLLKTGFVDRIVKLDYNSLYPSIILTWNIDNKVDAMGVLNTMLNYVLSQREKYKELKANASDKIDVLKDKLDNCNSLEKKSIEDEIKYWKSEKSGNDKKQLPLKILGNSYFGSAGAEHLFPWGDNIAAEKTTCIGRMSLRLMISHFTKLGYKPIVGDSFTADTPLFIKYDIDGIIDIKPVCELIGETKMDELGREYDTSIKPYKVLCRSGWVRPSYIYRHKTNKPLYTVSEGEMSVTVTEDHSLFDEQQHKIKPSEITNNSKLEYYSNPIETNAKFSWLTEQRARTMARMLMGGTTDRVGIALLNTENMNIVKEFLDELGEIPLDTFTKTCQAGIMFLKNKVYGKK